MPVVCRMSELGGVVSDRTGADAEERLPDVLDKPGPSLPGAGEVDVLKNDGRLIRIMDFPGRRDSHRCVEKYRQLVPSLASKQFTCNREGYFTNHFASAPEAGEFEVRGPQTGPNHLQFNLGMMAHQNGAWTIPADYTGDIAAHATDQGVTMGARYTL